MSRATLIFLPDGARIPAGATPVATAAPANLAGYRRVPGADPVLEVADETAKGRLHELALTELDAELAATAEPCRLAVVELGDGSHALALLAEQDVERSRGAWDHSSLAVGDLDVALAFYKALLGFEVAFAERGMTDQIASITGVRGLDCDIAQLHAPAFGHVLELIAFRGAPRGAEASAPVRPGMGHAAFVVSDLDDTLAAVERLGGRVLGTITRFEDGVSAYCREPAGSFIELSERRASA